jgi:small-conductance mechanosensitive channel
MDTDHNKKPLFIWQITLPFLFIIAVLIWNMSSGATKLEGEVAAVYEKINSNADSADKDIKQNEKYIKENSATIKAQAKITNKIAIDTATLRVQLNHMQKQNSRTENLILEILREIKK